MLNNRSDTPAPAPGSAPAPGESPDYAKLLPVLLVLVVWLVYQTSFDGKFVFDDHGMVTGNKFVESLTPLTKFWPDSRPLVMFSIALNYAYGELNPIGYHLFNVAIHMLAGLTLFGILRRTMSLRRFGTHVRHRADVLAFIIALLWLVHPLTTQSVTYIIQRGESMMGLFYLLTLYAAVRAAQADDKPAQHRAWMFAAVVAAMLGALCKQVIFTVPIVVLIFDRTLLSSSFAAALKKRWPMYLGLLATWLLVFKSLGYGSELMAEDTAVGFNYEHFTWFQFALTEAGVLLHYMKLIVWPHPLCFDYQWQLAEAWYEYVPQTLAIFALLFAMFYALAKRSWLGVVGVWFFFILAPTSSIVPIQDIAVEHRVYLPMIAGLVLIVAAGYAVIHRLSQRVGQVAAVTVTVLCVAGLSWLTVRRNYDYHDDLRLWITVTKTAPHNFRAHNNVGTAAARRKNLDLAKKAYANAIKLKEDYAQAHFNMGVLYRKFNQWDLVEQHAQRAVAISPKYASPYLLIGRVRQQQGRIDEAIAAYQKGIDLNPNFAAAYGNLGTLWAMQGQYEKAKTCLFKALELDPSMEGPHTSLARVYELEGDFKRAAHHYQKLIELAPDTAPAQNAMGLLFARKGNIRAAGESFNRAITIDPDYAEAHLNLGKAFHNIGYWARAIEHYRRAVELDNMLGMAHRELAWLLATVPDEALRDGKAALASANRAVEIEPQNPMNFDALAAAQAECKDYTAAVGSIQQALALTDSVDLTKRLKQRLTFYQNHQPYRLKK